MRIFQKGEEAGGRDTGTGVDLVAYLALVGMSVCMACTFMFLDWALAAFSPVEVAAWRIILAALVLVPLAGAMGVMPQRRELWLWAVLMAVLNFAAPFFFLAWGMQFLPSSVPGTYFAAMPLVVVALAGIVLRVKITGRKVVGLAIGAVGLAVMARDGTGGDGTPGAGVWPHLAVFAAILCYALSGLAVRLMAHVHPFGMIGAGALLACIPAGHVVGRYGLPEGATVWAWAGLFGVAVVSTAMAHTLRFFLIRRKGPVFLAPNAYLSTVLVYLLAVGVLGEPIGSVIWIAFPLIVVGLLVAQDGSGHMRQV